MKKLQFLSVVLAAAFVAFQGLVFAEVAAKDVQVPLTASNESAVSTVDDVKADAADLKDASAKKTEEGTTAVENKTEDAQKDLKDMGKEVKY